MSFKSILQGQQQQLLEVGGADSEVDSMSGLEKCSRSHLSSPCHNYYSDEDLDLFPPSGKRLAPVGAASNEDEPMASASPNPLMSQSLISNSNELEERLKQMEEDQEEMNTNLIALTSHFAKVTYYFVSPPSKSKKSVSEFLVEIIKNLDRRAVPKETAIMSQLLWNLLWHLNFSHLSFWQSGSITSPTSCECSSRESRKSSQGVGAVRLQRCAQPDIAQDP